ncbi:MAG: NADH:flavin oxidoreductase, partial [Thermodesulfobacteriota bacterium]
NLVNRQLIMKHLFEETSINGMRLSNRFVRSATWDGMATDSGEVTHPMIALMRTLAEGGVGVIITGHAFVHEKGKHQPRQLGIHHDDLIPGLLAMTQAVHDNGGRIVVQLGYGGAYLSKQRIREMTHQDIRNVADAFGRAAKRGKEAGFDGVQILAAHGFLLSQFLCPRYNDRADEYGGSLSNRGRILMETLQSIRSRVGSDYPVLVKLNCQDFTENGLTLEESVEVGRMLQEHGIDGIELSGGLLNNPNLMKNEILEEKDEAYFKEEAKEFKRNIHVPLILVGGIRSYPVSQRLVEEQVADYISLCRPLIREPDLIRRWKAGDLRKAFCISCNNCIEQAKSGRGLSCVPLEPERAETFFVQHFEEIPASSPHPAGTGYRVSFGLEQQESAFVPVVKIQMVRDGKIMEQSPSFPIGSQDHLRVFKTIEDLLKKSPQEG